MMHRLFWLLALFTSSFLYSSAPSDVIPQALVGGYVDAVSGDFVDCEDDFTLASIDTLSLVRSYSSSWGQWRLLPHLILVDGKVHKSHTHVAHAFDSTGTPFECIRKHHASHYSCRFETPLPSTARQYAYFADNSAQRHDDHFLVTMPDGTLRSYHKVSTSQCRPLGPLSVPLQEYSLSDKDYFRLTSERLPSNNKLLYHYTKEGHLQAIELVDRKGKSYAALLFQYAENTLTVICRSSGSERQIATYHCKDGVLASVTRATKPSIAYAYKSIQGKMCLIKKELPENRHVRCAYDDSARVVELSSPSHHAPIYTFRYEQGRTEVTDPFNTVARFSYNDALLSAIEYFHGGSIPLRKDTFSWNVPDVHNVQTLRCYTLSEPNANTSWRCIHAVRYAYDKKDKQRIIHEDTYKASSSDVTAAIQFDGSGLPSGDNKSSISTTYSTEHPWHLREFEDSAGTSIHYHYSDTSNRLTEKLTFKNSKITQREFLEYDSATGQLVKAIQDDGESKSKENLSGATVRTIRKITPRRFHAQDEEMVAEQRYNLKTHKKCFVTGQRTIYDAYGNSIKTILYNTKKKQAKVEEFAYDDHGNCTRSVNPIGEVTLYHFDRNDNCIQIEAPGITVDHTYDHADRLVTTTKKYIEGSSVTTRAAYDAFDRLASSKDRYGNETQYVYDAFSRCTGISYPKNETGFCLREQFDYDLLGNCRTVKNQKGEVTWYRYNGNNQLISVRYPDLAVEEFLYNKQGRLHRKLNTNNTATTFTYDDDHNLKNIQTQLIGGDNRVGQKLSSIDVTYADKRPVETKKEHGKSITRTYDRYGRLKSQIEANSKSKKEYHYDTLHRLVGVSHYIDDTHAITEAVRYDRLDRVIARWTIEPDGTKTGYTIYSYDSFGNVTTTAIGLSFEKVTYIEGTRPHRIINAYGGVTHINYYDATNDTGGQYPYVVITDPVGTKTTLKYTIQGHLKEKIVADAFGTVLSECVFSYDDAGNMEYLQEGNIQRTWDYGPMNRPHAIHEEGRVTKFSFTKDGLLQAAKRDNSTTSYEYSPDGEQLKKISKDGHEMAFQHDEAGNVISGIMDGKKTTERAYNTHGQVISETIHDEWGAYTTHYSYDRIGRLTEIVLPDSSSIAYRYVGTRLLAVVRNNKKGKEEYRHEYTKYSEQGQLLEEKCFTDEKRVRRYEPSGALKTIESKYFSSRVTKRDWVGTPLQIESDNKVTTFTYDGMYRLIREEGDTVDEYSYDAVNNITKHSSKERTYNKMHHLLTKGDTHFSYDSADNLTSTSYASLEYNAHNQLTSYKKTNAHTPVQYEWDVYGRRILRKEGSSISRMFFIGNTEIGSLDIHGDIKELKIPARIIGSDVQGAVAIELHGRPYLPSCDLLGNVVSLYSPRSKQIVERYAYTAFGRERIWDEDGKEREDSELGNPWRYRCLRTDPTTGLVQFAYRDYSPSIQRFLTPDPLGYENGLNPYVYALNNPVRYNDIYGLRAVYGPCDCHGNDCEIHTHGRCGHGGETVRYIDDEETDPVMPFDGPVSPSEWRRGSAGTLHGGIEFAINTLHDLELLAVWLLCSKHDLASVLQMQAERMAGIGNYLPQLFGIDPHDPLYDGTRHTTSIGAEVGSLLIGAQQALKMGLKLAGTAGRWGARVAAGRRVAQRMGQGAGVAAGEAASEIAGAVGSLPSHLRDPRTVAEHLRQVGEYGKQSWRQLSNGRIRYYDPIKLADKPGLMAGTRRVREWDPLTNKKRTWFETLDHNGKVRRVRPQRDDKIKNHHVFGENGQYEGIK